MDGVEPLAPADVARVFESIDIPWWIAGPHAIDAFLAREREDDGDVEVGVLRRDQLALQSKLAGWDLRAADPPGRLRPWLEGETLPDTTFEVWCRPSPDAAWGLQLLLEESKDEEWVYRRSPAVHRPISTLSWTLEGIPHLAVEVQLLYMAGRVSPRNEAEFTACLPQLSPEQRRWLTSALALGHPGHPWIERLEEQGRVA